MNMQKNGMKFLRFIVALLFVAALFLPKNTNRYLITAIAAIGIVVTAWMFLLPLLSRLPKVGNRRKASPSSDSDEAEPVTDMETLLWRQISYQITGKLKSAYPEATWDFSKRPSVDRLLAGKPLRIRTTGTKNYNFAEVRMDQFGNLVIQMMTIEALKGRAVKAGEPQTPQVDPESWYTLIGRPLLTNLVGELQARGHQKLYINEKGEIYVQNGDTQEVKGTFEHFPPRNYWTALSDIFIHDELNAKETEQALELSWIS